MVLPDVNVLVYAYRSDSPRHRECLQWLDGTVNADEAYAMSDMVLNGFVRVVTHPMVFRQPSPVGDALAFADQVRSNPNCVRISPGDRHWDIFRRLCAEHRVRGNLVPDAYLALAIESGCEWVSTERDFGPFKGLRWSEPDA